MIGRKALLTIVATATVATVSAQDDGFLRNLAGKVPKYYEDAITINFNATLGCGACIRGGYIYCMPGAEGSDPSTWGTNKSVCCQNAANCPTLTNKAYNCSNQFTDKVLAKGMCPFKKSACGENSSFDFTEAGQTQVLDINVPLGETCTYQVRA